MTEKLPYLDIIYARRMVRLINRRAAAGNHCYRPRSTDQKLAPIIREKLSFSNFIMYQQFPEKLCEWTMGRRDFMEIVDKDGNHVEADRSTPKNYKFLDNVYG
jgi:hypothetical protein